jgi:sulfur relay (sulfurtransferase) DsrF/TusC family protein
MRHRVLFIIASDPRNNARPAEAIRVAAGVGAWKKVGVTVYLRGPAVLALAEFPDEWVDADNYENYLPLLGGLDSPVYVAQDEPLLRQLGEARLPYKEIDDAALARLCADHDSVMRF